MVDDTQTGSPDARLNRLARQEFIATHRPKLIVRFVLLHPLVPGSHPTVDLTVANVGDTDATVYGIRADVARRQGNHWVEPGLLATAVTGPASHIVKSGERKLFTVRGAANLAEEDITAVKQGRHRLCLVGEIEYWDDNRVPRHTGFFRIYMQDADRFERAPDAEEEYVD